MMGQHKYNPTAIAAARGELPPKPPKKSKRQRDAEMHMAVLAALAACLAPCVAAAFTCSRTVFFSSLVMVFRWFGLKDFLPCVQRLAIRQPAFSCSDP